MFISVSFVLLSIHLECTLEEMSNFKSEDFHEENMHLPIFPEPIDKQISSENFLSASNRVVKILDCFGKIFMPVKFDMQKNIDKLTYIYNLDRKRHSTLQKMLFEQKNKMENSIAIDALLWLRRALHMIQLFFQFIVHDFEAGKGSEDLVACLNKAYSLSLEHYHGFMAQQLFSLLSRMMPTRSQILLAISDGYDVKQEIIIKSMARFSERLSENIVILKDFYEENDWESTYKV